MTKSVRLSCLACLVNLAAVSAGAGGADHGPLAERLVKASGVQAGLCLHVGCGDGALTAELARRGSFYVHALAADRPMAERARRRLAAAGLHGERVAVEAGGFGRLPYADNLANLVVVDEWARLSKEGLTVAEVERVLAPSGVAVLGVEEPRIVRKPRPKETDDWTHPRHGPDGNPVSQDALAGPSPQLRWLAGPLWGHHRGPAGAIAADGRLLYVLRERPLGTAIVPRFFLIARDAHNGMLLWKRPVGAVKQRYGYGAKVPAGALVAGGGRLFAVLETGKPLNALDPATGKVLKTYVGQPSPECVLYRDGVLLLARRTALAAIEAETGKPLWNRSGTLSRARNVWTSSAALIGQGRVFFLHAKGRTGPPDLISVDLKTGRQLWRKGLSALLPGWQAPAGLVLHYKGVLVLRDRAGLHVISAADGACRWSRKGTAVYVYGMRELIWVQGKTALADVKYGWVGLEPATGRQKAQWGVPTKLPSHIRGRRILDGQCNFPLATERYFVSTTRMSLIDARTGRFHNTMITRGPCKFLLALPANGLLYAFPKDCVCYPCLRGLLAYSPAPKDEAKPTDSPPLEKGPAHGQPVARPAGGGGADEWPSYRHDAGRSAASPAVVPARLAPAWTADLGGKLSAPVVAEGKVFVASVDRHQVRAVDAKTGRAAWTFLAGGRVDSPPTVHAGLCLFGCRNGWVYCLRADDGRLVWRLRAAPAERRIVAFGQPESPWPVFGAVLVHDGVACFSAGHHANAEGGIGVWGVEPATGKVLWRNAPTYEVINNVLQLTAKGNVYLGPYKMSFDPKTGRRVKDRPWLRAPNASFLNDEVTRVIGAFDGRRAAMVYHVEGNRMNRGAANVPGRGFEVALRPQGAPKAPPVWYRQGLPVRINSVVLTKDVVFVAGPADGKFDPAAKNPWAMIDGQLGSLVLALSAGDGKELGRVRLPSPPVRDGLAAAHGRLYVSTRAGLLLSLAGGQ